MNTPDISWRTVHDTSNGMRVVNDVVLLQPVSEVSRQVGDNFHIVADCDVSLEEAPELAPRVRDWLVGEGITLPQLFDNVVYGDLDTRGYLPGPNVARAMDDPDEARELLEIVREIVEGRVPLKVSIEVDGVIREEDLVHPYSLHIAVERDCFNSHGDGFGYPDSGFCPRCSVRVYWWREQGDEKPTSSSPMWQTITQAIDDWIEGGSGTIHCPHCRTSAPVSEWNFDPPYAFGNLGFLLWNWTWLSDDFVAEMGRQLGHRVIGVRCNF